MKEKLILIYMIAIISFSGCTLLDQFFPHNNQKKTEPLIISLESDLTNVQSNDITYLYLILDNLDKDEIYDTEAKIMNPGIFEVIKEPKATSLSGLEKETLEWTLQAPKVETETSSPVGVEVKLSKSFEFYLPIKFVNPNYLREREQRGDPVPKDQKNYYFSDSLISVSVTLNKNPPLDTKVAYANLKINSKIGGILDAKSVSSKDGNCYLDRLNTASCRFGVGDVDKIKEKKFKITIEYYVKITKSLDFVILPEVAEEVPYIPPAKPPAGITISLKDMDTNGEINFGIINFSEDRSYYYYVLGVEKPIDYAILWLDIYVDGVRVNKVAKLINITSISNDDFCKLVGILEFSCSDDQSECTKTGFCIMTPLTPSKPPPFCGTEKAKDYIESIGLTPTDLLTSIKEFNGSLLYDYQSNKWCYIQGENVSCNEISNKFNDGCESGDLLKSYVNIDDSGNSNCYKENEYISWYFSGNITLERPIIHSGWCMEISLESPVNLKYYEPSSCSKKYESSIYLRVNESANEIEIYAKQQKNQKS